MQAELPGPSGFDAASALVRVEDMHDVGTWGPDVEPYLDKLRTFRDAGHDRVALVQVGPEQDAFCDWYARVLAPAAAQL